MPGGGDMGGMDPRDAITQQLMMMRGGGTD
jgi:hypothetical protein